MNAMEKLIAVQAAGAVAVAPKKKEINPIVLRLLQEGKSIDYTVVGQIADRKWQQVKNWAAGHGLKGVDILFMKGGIMSNKNHQATLLSNELKTEGYDKQMTAIEFLVELGLDKKPAYVPIITTPEEAVSGQDGANAAILAEIAKLKQSLK